MKQRIQQFYHHTATCLVQDQPLYPVNERQRSLMNAIPLHIGCIDESGCYDFWNPHSEEMFGYRAKEVIGVFGLEVILNDKNIGRKIYDCVANNGVFDDEVVLRNRDGYSFPARMILLALKNDSGETKGYFEFAHDMSSLKALKEEIVELKTGFNSRIERLERNKKNIESQLAILSGSIMPRLNQIEVNILQGINTINLSLNNNKKMNFSDMNESNALALSITETKVAQLIAEGRSSKEIADKLNISPLTVSFHRKKIRKKFGICNQKTSLYNHITSLKR